MPNLEDELFLNALNLVSFEQNPDVDWRFYFGIFYLLWKHILKGYCSLKKKPLFML